MAAPATPPFSWTDLFATKGPADFTLAVRVLEKSGQDFLVLPVPPAMAAQALSLYPAQRRISKLAKSALGAALRFRLPVGLRGAAIQLSRNDPFPQFLASLAGTKGGSFPFLAILAGNPRVEGRRFIVLLFDAQGKPAFVVKAGIGASARRLIQRESVFLQTMPGGIAGVPQFHRAFASEQVEALALAYVEGESPTGEDYPAIGRLLGGWLSREETIGIAGVPAWQKLEKAGGAVPLIRRLSQELADYAMRPALSHGDFAPWNIKVCRRDGSWTALDWERGERIGFPGWDWFHYVIQTGVLVGRLTPEQLAGKLEDLFKSDPFKKYAAAAGINGRERILALACLVYCVEILRPTEGLETVRGLLALLEARWLKV